MRLSSLAGQICLDDFLAKPGEGEHILNPVSTQAAFYTLFGGVESHPGLFTVLFLAPIRSGECGNQIRSPRSSSTPLAILHHFQVNP